MIHRPIHGVGYGRYNLLPNHFLMDLRSSSHGPFRSCVITAMASSFQL